MKEEAK